MQTLLRLEGVSYAPRPPPERPVLERLSLDVPAEGISLVLGPNGAGKTSLIHLLAGVLSPSSGRLRWYPEAPAASATSTTSTTPAARPRVALLRQQALVLRLSLLNNVAFVVPPPLGARQRRLRAAEALERVGLLARAHDPATQLSGGERQRLALARAWALQPRLLLLDEPTAHLDPSATAAIETIIRELRSHGAKVLMSTHNLAQAARLGDTIIFLAGGRLRETASVARFFARPQSPEAQSFLKGESPWELSFVS